MCTPLDCLLQMETVGDCFVVSAGLVEPDREGFVKIAPSHDPIDSALCLVAFAKDALAYAGTIRMPGSGSNVTVSLL